MVLERSSRDKEALTPVEKAADGAIARTRLEKHLSSVEFLVLDALHTIPIGELRRRKVRVCGLLAKELFAGYRFPQAFIADQVRWWAGGSGFCTRTEMEWAEKLRCSARTILYHRNGRPDRKKPGIATTLDAVYKNALARVDRSDM